MTADTTILKQRIGITPGSITGMSYRLVLQAFEDPTALELCTPIFFGEKEVAIQYKKDMDITTNFITIQQADEIQDDRLNLMECTEEERVAVSDGLDGMVIGPTRDTIPLPDDAMEVWAAPDIRMIVASAPTNELVEQLYQTLQRDFDCQRPRIAILADKPAEDYTLPQAEEEKRFHLYGPFATETFFEQGEYQHFDAIILTEEEKASTLFCQYARGEGIRIITGHGKPLAVAMGEALTQAIYAVIDITRNRSQYDEARRNPLPKLFHDRREDRRASSNIE